MNTTNYLKIGELANQTGLAVGTLRYYSDLKILLPVHIGENGYRYYSENASSQVQFIKKAQALGFTLEQIKQILDVRDRGEKPCSLVQTLLNNKIEQLEIQIKQMTLFREELKQYRANWKSNPDVELGELEVCPLISSVSVRLGKII